MNLEKQCLDASMPLRLTGRGVQHVFEQPLQIADGPVRRDAQLLEWLIEAIHPDGRIAERFRTGRVPPAKRRKDDVFLLRDASDPGRADRHEDRACRCGSGPC